MHSRGISVKTRLAVLFMVLVALLLAGFSWAIYAIAEVQRGQVFDSELKVNAVAAATIALRSDNLSDSVLAPFRRKLMEKVDLENLGIFDLDDRMVYHQGDRIPVPSREVKARTLDHGEAFTAVSDTQQAYLSFQDEDKTYVVAISGVDGQGLKMLAKLKWALMLGYVVSLLIVLALGRWFAGRAMAPLDALTRQARSISASDLKVRVQAGSGGDEFDELAQAFNGMLDRLENAFNAQKQFIANASHELRTPLTALEGQLEVALMHPRDVSEYRRTLLEVLDETRALRFMTNNLLLLTKANIDLQASAQLAHRLDEVLMAAVGEAKKRYPHRQIEVEYLEAPEEESQLMVRGNEDLLRKAILNVVENALKYSPRASPVKVTLEASQDQLVLCVRDGGAGIAKEDIPRIFDPFYRSPRTQSVPGSGVGLTLVKAVLDRHHGGIAVESAPGQGTTVRIILPVARPPVEEPASAQHF